MVILLILAVSLFMKHNEASLKSTSEEGLSKFSNESDEKNQPSTLSQKTGSKLNRSNTLRKEIIRKKIIPNSIITQSTEDAVSVKKKDRLDSSQAQYSQVSKMTVNAYYIPSFKSQYQEIQEGHVVDFEANTQFLRKYSLSVDDILTGRLSKISLLENNKSLSNAFLSQSSSPEIGLSKLSKLTLNDFRNYFIFDEFNDSCSHGNKVLDVIKQVLHKYNLEYAFKKVIIRKINYFNNIEEGDSLYRTYCVSYRYGDIRAVVDQETLEKNAGSNEYSPSNYLNAIYTLAVDEKPDVISSSFVSEGEDAYARNSFSGDNKATNYFTAALNDAIDLDSINSNLRSGLRPRISSYLEPLYTYQLSLENEGTIVVGNQIDSSRYLGMFSRTGTKVTVLGKGASWGLVGCTNCIDSLKDVGTSFATPEVATKMFIAKAFWRRMDQNIVALEARNRLILATNLQPSLVGKFASAGSVDLQKLLEFKKGFLVRNDGSIVTIDSLYGEPILYYGQHGQSLSATDVGSIRSIYNAGSKTYIIKNQNNCYWQPSEEPSKMNIVYRVDGTSEVKVLTKTQFYKNYTQFVLLN
jgi:hypothetical protein